MHSIVRPTFCTTFIFLIAFTCSHIAFADDTSYQNFAPGAHAAMLGGAYTAIADDSSGLYFNPAGIVDVRRANLSISTSLYGFERRSNVSHVENLAQWSEQLGAQPLTGADINIVPASSGVAWAFGRQLPDGSFPHGVALGLVVPSFRGHLQQQEFTTGNYAISTLSRSSDRSMLFSGGYAYRVGPWLRLGVAAHTQVRLVENIEEFSVSDSSSTVDNPVFLSTSSDLSLSNASVLLSVGAKLHPARHWLVGAMLSTPSLSVYQRGQFRMRTARANFDQAQSSPTAFETHSSQVRWLGSVQPFWGRVGVAYMRAADFALSLDVSMYAATRYQLVQDRCLATPGGEFAPVCALNSATQPSSGPLPDWVQRSSPIPVDVDRRFVANINLGIEKMLSKDFSVGLGAFTDFSSAQDYILTEDDTLSERSTRVDDLDHYGATVGVGFLGEHSLSRLGIMGAFGVGREIRTGSPGSRFIQSAKLDLQAVAAQDILLYVFWSSTFRYGEGRTRLQDSELSI